MATNRYEGNTGRYIRLPDAYSESEYPPRPRMRPGRFPEPPVPVQEETSASAPAADAGSAHSRNGAAPPGQGSHAAREKNTRPGGNNAPDRNKRKPAQTQSAARRGDMGGLENLLSGFSGRLSGRLGNLETEDLLLLAVVYLMYRESGDKELLVVLAALLFL